MSTFLAKTSVTVTDAWTPMNRLYTCLGHLGQGDTDHFYFCNLAKAGKEGVMILQVLSR
jgi:hypothetical protein